MATSPELQVLQEFSGLIQDAMIEPLSLSTKLYSKDILDRRVYYNVTDHSSHSTSYERALSIIKGIEAKLLSARTSEERETIFMTVLDVMCDQIPLDSVSERMNDKYQQVKSAWVEPQEELVLHTRTPVGEFKDVLNSLHTVSDQWYYIGMQLSVPTYILNSTRNNSRTDKDRLIETLDYWTKNGSDDKTWETIVSALTSPFVERKELARTLKRKFIDRQQ